MVTIPISNGKKTTRKNTEINHRAGKAKRIHYTSMRVLFLNQILIA